MKKTNELTMFEEMVDRNLAPETPQHANEVILQGVSSDFISQAQNLYSSHLSNAVGDEQDSDD